MTKPTLAMPHSTPTEADIAEFGTCLARFNQDRGFAYATGYLGSLIGTLAEQHQRCRRRDCLTCDGLRRGLALVAAIDRVEHAATGGAR